MLLFLHPQYIICELVGISITVFLLEYYFAKLIKAEIEDKVEKMRLSVGMIFILFAASKVFVFCLG
jgi:hypothetical protein